MLKQTNNNKVSIIIATKNSASFLTDALNSLVRAGHAVLEVIIVDQQSNDGTLEIINNFIANGKIKDVYLVKQVGHGLYAAWNQALALATGEFITFLDSDDYWTDNRIKLAVDYLLTNADAKFVVGHFKFFLQQGCEVPKGFKHELFQQTLLGRIPGTMMARRNVFDVVGSFNADYEIAADVDWFARAKDLGLKYGVLPDILLYKRIHQSNLSSYAEKNNAEILKLLRDSIRRGEDPK